MGISSTSAEKLARSGANLEITAESGYSSTSVEKLVKLTAAAGGQITIHAADYSSVSLEKFVSSGKRNVTIVI